MSQREVAGAAITGYLNYVKKAKGSEGLNSCLRQTQLDVIGIKEPLRYPYDYQIRVLKWIQANQGDEALVRAGRFAATDIGVLKFFARFASVEGIMKNAEERYKKTLFFGSIETKLMEPGHAEVVITDGNDDRVNCIAWKGVLMGLGDLAKLKRMEVKEVKCRFIDGGDMCIYDCRW